MIIFLSFKHILTLCGSLNILSKSSLLIKFRNKDIQSDGQSEGDEIFIFLSFSTKVLNCVILYFKEGNVFNGLNFVPRVIMDLFAVGPSGFLSGYLSTQSYLE